MSVSCNVQVTEDKPRLYSFDELPLNSVYVFIDEDSGTRFGKEVRCKIAHDLAITVCQPSNRSIKVVGAGHHFTTRKAYKLVDDIVTLTFRND